MLDFIWEKLGKLIIDWPSLLNYKGIGLLISILGICLKIISLAYSKRKGNLLLNAAKNKLKVMISSRLNDPDLVSASSIKGLAYSIQQAYQTPVLTDALIASTIREIALEQEELLRRGKRIKIYLSRLNEALKEFDPKGPMLMSIAYSNRVLAYSLSIIAFSITAFALQLLLTRSSQLSFLEIPLFWSLAFLQFGLAFLCLQSGKYWGFWLKHIDTSAKIDMPAVENPPTIASFNLFLKNTQSSEFKVHIRWAPYWEEMLFNIVPAYFVSLAIGWITYKARHYLGIDPTKITKVISLEILLCFVAIVLFTRFYFFKFHSFEYFLLRRQQNKLQKSYKQLRLAELGYKKVRKEKIQNFIDACNQLWILTGHEYYKNLREFGFKLLSNPEYIDYRTSAQEQINSSRSREEYT